MEFVRPQIVEYGLVPTDVTAVSHPATILKIPVEFFSQTLFQRVGLSSTV